MDRRVFCLLSIGSTASALLGTGANAQLLPSSGSDASYCRNRLRDFQRTGTLDIAALNSRRAVIDDERFFQDQINERLYSLTSVVLLNPTDRGSAQQLAATLVAIGNSKYATSVSKNSTSNLLHTDFLLLFGYGILALREVGALDAASQKTLTKMMSRRVGISNYKSKFYYEMKGCVNREKGRVSNDPWGCQNHTYGVQHVRMLLGVLAGQRREIGRGAKLYKYAIDDLAPDGALWREAVRGAYSWTYYTHALGHLIAIGDLDLRMGGGLFAYQNRRGQSVHDAVRFYIASMSDPKNTSLMHRYASRNLGVEGRGSLSNNPLSMERWERARSRQSYQEWFPIYRANFRDRPETAAFQRIAGRARDTSGTYHLGLDTWCVYR